MDIHRHAANGDVAALQAVLARGESVDARNEQDETPLMIAAQSPQATLQTLRLLIDHGADVNAMGKDRRSSGTALHQAAMAGSLEKMKLLIGAGADVRRSRGKGYSTLLDAVFGGLLWSVEERRAILEYLIDAGAPLDAASDYGEAPVTVASIHGAFDIVRFLLDRGADPTPLEWTPLHHAAVFGALSEVDTLLHEGPSLEQIDHWERTPFLLSIHSGRRDVAELLLRRGSSRAARGRCGMTPLMYAIARDDAAIIAWLVAEGWDVEEADEFGNFPLQFAAQRGSASCVEALLRAGASKTRRDGYGDAPVRGAGSPEVVQLLLGDSSDYSEVEAEMRIRLTRSVASPTASAAEQDFRAHKNRQFGQRNPQRMNNPFWDEMVRSREAAYFAAVRFGENGYDRKPVWCCSRFGQSMTRLPDGRFVEVGGEHEDSYDPDFCIYNDVIVHHGDGTFDLYGYPEVVFPPTDFHSATLVGDHIYAIGCLGYTTDRRPGHTPVYRLDCRSWKIERIETSGENPGWIFKHTARLIAADEIEVRGGQIQAENSSNFIENERVYVLNLSRRHWRLIF